MLVGELPTAVDVLEGVGNSAAFGVAMATNAEVELELLFAGGAEKKFVCLRTSFVIVIVPVTVVVGAIEEVSLRVSP